MSSQNPYLVVAVAGDGTTDDTAAVQKAIDDAPSGARLLFPAGARCRLARGLRITRGDLSLDLNHATLLGAGIQPLLTVSGGRDVQLSNGRIELDEGASAPAVVIEDAVAARVERCRAETGGAPFVVVQGGRDHIIASNWVRRGSIEGRDCEGVLVGENVLEESPSHAISFGPCRVTRYLDNVVRNHGGDGIREVAEIGDPTGCVGAMVRGNRISEPATGSGAGIRVHGSEILVDGNTVEDSVGTAIEVLSAGARVTANRASWEAERNLATAVHLLPVPGFDGPAGAVVATNQIHMAGRGIAITHHPDMGQVVVLGNVITDVEGVGIDMGSGAVVVCSGNVLRFSRQPTVGGTRLAIITTSDAVVLANEVRYIAEPAAGGPGDIPLRLVGDRVTLIANAVHGGGVAVRSAPPDGASLTGWTLIANRFEDGAVADFSGISQDGELRIPFGELLPADELGKVVKAIRLPGADGAPAAYVPLHEPRTP